MPVVLYAMLLLTTLTTGFRGAAVHQAAIGSKPGTGDGRTHRHLEHIAHGVLIVREGLIERANPAVAEMVGSSPSALKGTQAQLLHADATSLDGIVSALFGEPSRGITAARSNCCAPTGRRSGRCSKPVSWGPAIGQWSPSRTSAR